MQGINYAKKFKGTAKSLKMVPSWSSTKLFHLHAILLIFFQKYAVKQILPIWSLKRSPIVPTRAKTISKMMETAWIPDCDFYEFYMNLELMTPKSHQVQIIINYSYAIVDH